MDKPQGIERFDSSTGAVIMRIPLEVFPAYNAFSHLVAYRDRFTLVDVGSGFGNSHCDLIRGLEIIRDHYGFDVSLERIDQIIITHGHIDHFGGLAQVREVATAARIVIHELARPVLINYDERLLVTRQRMGLFLQRTGVSEERRRQLLEMHMLGKRAFTPQPVDVTLKDGELLDDTFRVIHVPGHEAGLIMLQVGDILLTADHVLPHTSVALAPESIMPYTGVGHYIESLDKARHVEGVRVALGGHEQAMPDYYDVVDRTRASAVEKVERVHEICAEPSTVFQIATRIYGQMDDYSELLKLGQTGARIEYLNQRGLVMVDNIDALELETNPTLVYRRV